MGSHCSTPKNISHLPRKTRLIVAPFPNESSPRPCSAKDSNKDSAEDLRNHPRSFSTFSFQSKTSRFDIDSEEVPKPKVSPSNPSYLSPSYSDFQKKANFQYKKGPLIEEGSEGEIYECLNLSSGELLAMKSITIYGERKKYQEHIEALSREVDKFKGFCHPNIARYYAVDATQPTSREGTTINVILEYVSGGSLKKLLRRFERLDERIVSNYTKQIIDGLSYLHKNGIVHRNLSISNVLIDASGVIKLSDFGYFGTLEKLKNEDNPKPSYWAAPEVIMKKSQGTFSDIWSLGCIVVEMLTGLTDTDNPSGDNEYFYKSLDDRKMSSSYNDLSANCRDFLEKILNIKPEERPSAQVLLEHPFLTDLYGSISSLDNELVSISTELECKKLKISTIDPQINQQNQYSQNPIEKSSEDKRGKLSLRKRIPQLAINVDPRNLIKHRIQDNRKLSVCENKEVLSAQTSCDKKKVKSWREYLTPDILRRNNPFTSERKGSRYLKAENGDQLYTPVDKIIQKEKLYPNSIFFPSPNKTNLSKEAAHSGEDYSASNQKIENETSSSNQHDMKIQANHENKKEYHQDEGINRDITLPSALTCVLEKRKLFEQKILEDVQNTHSSTISATKNENLTSHNQNCVGADDDKLNARRRFEIEMEIELQKASLDSDMENNYPSVII